MLGNGSLRVSPPQRSVTQRSQCVRSGSVPGTLRARTATFLLFIYLFIYFYIKKIDLFLTYLAFPARREGNATAARSRSGAEHGRILRFCGRSNHGTRPERGRSPARRRWAPFRCRAPFRSRPAAARPGASGASGDGARAGESHGPDPAARASAGDHPGSPGAGGGQTADILDTSRVISEDGKKKLKDLLHYYYPIEIDPNRTLEEKRPLMVEWWTKAHELLVQQKIHKSDIAQIVRESEAMLRDGFKEFFDQLHKNNIPLFIFSAGVGDILEEIIRQANVFYPNVNVVSNYMAFSDEGVLTHFKGPLIHTYNKNNSVLQGTGYFQQLSTRTSIILLGDSMGDLTMADGVPSVENILKIGFLNDKVEERRKKYLDSYDIVLESDETLDVVNGILRYLLAET
ncbi:7-methylguanosine phosphate-specific 5'-nucleotidase isoform X2 [Agelaius tricolor]|uniref:7-methylguanosine phosphate-specific 5'-nucleotidase isoform X2 n=1 Tax=Agelaius tricolor TaxID=9191 RepID=UPI0039F1C745